MDVSVKSEGQGLYVISPPAEMEWRVREQLVAALAAAGGEEQPRGVIVDLRGVNFITSAGLGAIFALRKHVASLGGAVVLARPNRTLWRLLRIVNLPALMPVRATLAEAREALKGAPAAQPC